MITEKKLKNYLNQGMTNREIANQNDVNIEKSTVFYWIKKYGLQKKQKYYSNIDYNSNIFNKINTPVKAYIIGFILGDGYLNEKNGKYISITIALKDKQILDFIANKTGGRVRVYKKINRKQKKFPHATLRIGSNRIYNDIKKYCGGRLKEDRHLPIINKKLERYLILGFFDAEGCVTWGNRKDRNRLWQKISFTSKFKMLEGVQKVLLKNDISSKIKPKQNEKCYVLQFSDKNRVLTFLDYIYPKDSNFIILQRKFKKAQNLRLELG
ncbi:MAG: LAGLIDADG family homing endonuclease [Bacillota bacterium]